MLQTCGIEGDLLDVYVSKFMENAITVLDLHSITDDQFREMDVKMIGHRNRIREQGTKYVSKTPHFIQYTSFFIFLSIPLHVHYYRSRKS